MKLENEKDYNTTMKKVDALMKKDKAGLTEKEAENLRMLALGCPGI
jgi:hypothetical protein